MVVWRFRPRLGVSPHLHARTRTISSRSERISTKSDRWSLWNTREISTPPHSRSSSIFPTPLHSWSLLLPPPWTPPLLKRDAFFSCEIIPVLSTHFFFSFVHRHTRSVLLSLSATRRLSVAASPGFSILHCYGVPSVLKSAFLFFLHFYGHLFLTWFVPLHSDFQTRTLAPSLSHPLSLLLYHRVPPVTLAHYNLCINSPTNFFIRLAPHFCKYHWWPILCHLASTRIESNICPFYGI